MQRNNLSMSIVCVSVLFGIGNVASAQPSSNVCASDGGAEICVRFDNLSEPPEAVTDFDFTFVSGVPSVDFTNGDDGAGTTYEWRVWAWNNATSQTPQAINDITASGAEDYSVQVRQPDGDDGATDVAKIDLCRACRAGQSPMPCGTVAYYVPCGTVAYYCAMRDSRLLWVWTGVLPRPLVPRVGWY